MSELIVDRLHTRYPGGIVALDGLSLSIARGELLAIVGPSGCGKSTLLRTIAGLERPDSGDILRDGRPLTGLPPFERGVFLAGQDSALYPHLSVRDNLAFGIERRRRARIAARRGRSFADLCGARRWLARPSAAATRRLERAADRWDCRDFWTRFPEELSAGQRQRASVARAALRRPRICLWDEPLAHLDPPLRLELRRQIRALHEETHAHTLCVTHDASEALAIGDRLAVLRAGRVEQIGTPDEVHARPATRFVASFVSTWGMNFLDDERVADSGPTAGDGRVTIGVRPEDVSWGPSDADASADARSGRRRVAVIVESVEPAGVWSLARARLAGAKVGPDSRAIATWSAVVARDARPAVGARATLWWTRAKEHRFDPATGTRVE